jgi:hypothetical protein
VGKVAMCKIKPNGAQKTVLVKPEKVQKKLDQGLTLGECANPSNGRVLCKTRSGERTNVLVPEKKVQKLLGKGSYTLGACEAP